MNNLEDRIICLIQDRGWTAVIKALAAVCKTKARIMKNHSGDKDNSTARTWENRAICVEQIII